MTLVAAKPEKLKQKSDTAAMMVRMTFLLRWLKKGVILWTLLAFCLVFSWDKLEIALREPKVILRQELSVLSQGELKAMKTFFDHLFFFDPFGQVFFGSKPMSIGRILPPFIPGYEAWRKVAPSFQSEKFVLREEIFRGYAFMFVANLDQISKVYEQNRDIFDTYPECCSWDDLKEAIRSGNSFFQKILEDHLAKGVLFGYGRGNAQRFTETLGWDLDKRGLEHVETWPPLFYYCFSPVMPCAFVCIPDSEETRELRERYERDRQVVIQKAKTEGLLNAMLSALSK